LTLTKIQKIKKIKKFPMNAIDPVRYPKLVIGLGGNALIRSNEMLP